MSISVVLLDYHIGISLPEAWQDIEILKLEIFRHFSTLSDVARDIAVKLLSPYGLATGSLFVDAIQPPFKELMTKCGDLPTRFGRVFAPSVTSCDAFGAV